MGKLLGFHASSDFALVIFLAGLGILTYGLLYTLLIIADIIEYPSWYDWDFYDVMQIVSYGLCIVGGTVLAIAGWKARKKDKK